MPIRSLPSGIPGAVIKDNPPILNCVVLAIADKQGQINIGVDGFQREDDAGGGLGSLEPERVIPGE